MTRLLVSVRSSAEALAALEGGADLIDVKEPGRGPLGAATADVWRQIQQAVAGRVPLSAALGELLDQKDLSLAGNSTGFAYVKAGLAGAAWDDDWQTRLAALQQALAPPTRLVAVAYADATRAEAPTPWQVLDAARRLRAPVLLIDTADKSRGDLFQSLGANELRELIEAAHHVGIGIALAGSLTLASVAKAKDLAPDWIAVRGAACAAGRLSAVSAEQVRRLKEVLAAAR